MSRPPRRFCLLLVCLAWATTSPAQAVKELEVDQPLEQSIAPGEQHVFGVHAFSGQYLRFEVRPNGLDLSASLMEPSGEKIVEVLNREGDRRPVPLSATLSADGDYRLQIALHAKAPGRYTVTLAAPRSAQPEDEKRIAAERAFAEGRALRAQGTKASFDRALERFHAALTLWRELNDRASEAATLLQIGSIHYRRSDPNTYLKYELEALPIWRALGDREGEGETLNNIGLAYWELGEREPALQSLRQSLPLRQAAGDQGGEAETLLTTATIYAESSEPQVGLRLLQQALELYRSAGDRSGQAATFNSFGVIYAMLRDDARALDSFTQALVLNRELRDTPRQGTSLVNIGAAYESLRSTRKALENLTAGLKLFRETGGQMGEGIALMHIGRVYSIQGDPEQALTYSEQALTIFRALHAVRAQASTLYAMAMAYLDTHRTQAALAAFEESRALARKVGDRALESNTLAGMAHAYRDEGDSDHAREAIETSIVLAESLRGSLTSSDLRTSYLSSARDRYDLLIDLLMTRHQGQPDAGDAARALEIGESSRARGLLDLLNESGAQIREGVDPNLLSREQSLQRSLDAKTQRQIRVLAGEHTAEHSSAMEKEIQTLTRQHEDVEAEIRQASPRYAALTQPQTLRAAQIQGLLDRQTLLLEYALGDRRSFLWVLGVDRVESFELPGRAAVEAAARRAYEELSSRDRPPAGERPIESLSRMVLGPAARFLEGKRLAIVADGALQYIPFAALTVPGEDAALITKHELVYLPSASTLGELRRDVAGRKLAPKRLAVIADPVFDTTDPRVSHTVHSDSAGESSGNLERSAKEAGVLSFHRLEGSRQEAQAIAKLAGAGSTLEALDFDASRKTATSPALSQYRIVHFATHGLLNSRHPELSGLVLSLVDRDGRPQNGFMEAAEIFNLKLGADLVVLSACQTALGAEIRGEGLVGLTRGFMYAGAPRVVASLWRIPDRATAELMRRFYRAMLVDGLAPPAALREAQVEMLHDSRFAAPYNWAGFVLQGEWR